MDLHDILIASKRTKTLVDRERTHYDTRKTEEVVIEWDGHVGDRYSVEMTFGGGDSADHGVYCKVSDVTPTVDDLEGATLVLTNEGVETIFICSKNGSANASDGTLLIQSDPNHGGVEASSVFRVVTEPFDDYEQTGLYFVRNNSAEGFVKSLTFISEAGELKTIDPKYIKDMYYDTRKTEKVVIEWDGTTEGKTVYEITGEDGATATLCKVSNDTPTLDELDGAVLSTIVMPDGLIEGITTPAEQLADGLLAFNAFVFIASKTPAYVDMLGITIGEPGVYFLSAMSDGTFIGRTVSLSYTANTGELKQLDRKYIPDMYGTERKLLGSNTVDAPSFNAAPDKLFAENVTLILGKEYTVVINGEKYETTCVKIVDSGYGISWLGLNIRPDYDGGSGDFNNAPFGLLIRPFYDGSGSVTGSLWLTLDDVGVTYPATVELYEEEITQIAPKYLPVFDLDFTMTTSSGNSQSGTFSNLEQLKAAYDANMSIHIVLTASVNSGSNTAVWEEVYRCIKDVFENNITFVACPSMFYTNLTPTMAGDTVSSLSLNIFNATLVKAYVAPF